MKLTNLLHHISILSIMTSKNLLITTEKTIQISNLGIALRLRCVICILIFSICILWVQNSFSQEFKVVQDESFYPTGSNQVIPPVGSSDMAVLKYTFSPYNSAVVIDVDIIPSVTRARLSSGGWGWYSEERANEPTSRTWYSIISADTLYTKDQDPPVYVLRSLQQFLVSKNLGTVTQRQNYIRLFHTFIDIVPYDFRNYLIRWILVGISIFLAIPLLWWTVKRFLR